MDFTISPSLFSVEPNQGTDDDGRYNDKMYISEQWYTT